MAEKSPLRRRMIEDMTIRNLSPATQRSYLYAVSRFSQDLSAHPIVSDWRTCAPTRSTLRRRASPGGLAEPGGLRPALLLRRDARRPTIPERIVYARSPRKLPTVLSADEVVKFLESVSSLKAHVALTTAYAAGLRVSEVAALKVSDIESGRMVMRIEHGKGDKERYAMLSAPLLGVLRSYWRRVRPPRICSPAAPDKPIEPTVLHAACRSAAPPAGLTNT